MSLEALEYCVKNNKHVLLDKPAGYNYEKFLKLVEIATSKNLIVEMGYMFRQHDGFSRIAKWSKSGKLGEIFMIRAHMSTNLPEKNPINNEISREGLSKFSGGVLYDLGGHMLDQICWILGRPIKVTSFFKNNNSKNKNFIDNAVVILEFKNAMSIIDIAAMETTPPARRFEVYGSKHSLLPKIWEVDAVGIGANNNEFLTPCFLTFCFSFVQSHLPESGVIPHMSNWKIDFDTGEPL